MTLPSKNQQIAAVMKYLDSDQTEGKSLDEIAKAIVEGFHEALSSGLDKPATPLRTGMLLKAPWDGKAWRVAWSEGDTMWFVGETSAYGWLGNASDPCWDTCEEYNPKKRVQIDGKNKMIEMTEADIAEAWDNADWKVGDKVSQHQRQYSFEVIAVGPKCALLRNAVTGVLVSDSNANLKQHYQREMSVKVGEVAW